MGVGVVTVEPSWTDAAACRGMDAVYFSFEPDDRAAAKATCRTCPVIAACLADALETESADYRAHAGVRAGRTPLQLVNLRRGLPRRPQRRSTSIAHGTQNGYQQHYRRGEVPCQACRDARNVYQAERREHRQANS